MNEYYSSFGKSWLLLLLAMLFVPCHKLLAADYVEYDYLNDVVCDKAYTRIYKEPTPEDPSFAIFMFIKDSGNGKQCVTWGGYENKDANILPKILIDGVDFAQPGWEMCWLNTNPDRNVDTWWDEKNSNAKIYTQEINGVKWTLRFNDVQRYDSRYYFVKMYFCPSEIEGGSKHTVTVKGRLTEYVGENTPSTTNYLDVERTFDFEAAKLITCTPFVSKVGSVSSKELFLYGRLAKGKNMHTYFGICTSDTAGNKFIPYEKLDEKQILPYDTIFSNIRYTLPQGKDNISVEMYRDISGLGEKVTCHYYDWSDIKYNNVSIVYHEKSEPTYRTLGYNQDCWENVSTGKYYSDAACTQVYDPLQITYAKLKSNPIVSKDYHYSIQDVTYNGVQFNWAAKLYDYFTYSYGDTYSADFMVYGNDVANARLKWMLNPINDSQLGGIIIDVYVNGKLKYRKDAQVAWTESNYSNIIVVPLEGLKFGDVVRFALNKIDHWKEDVHYKTYVTNVACLEYTSSDGGYVIYHKPTEPTYQSLGMRIGYWEVPATGKLYSDATCTQEIVNFDPSVVTYAKFISSPITANNGFTVKDAIYDDFQLNWVAETNYDKSQTGSRSVEFTVYGTNVDNARLVWYKNFGDPHFGKFIIRIFVNGVQKYYVDQNNDQALEGVFVLPFEELTSGDIVRFQIDKPSTSSWRDSNVTIAACLQYTSSDGGEQKCILTITADDKWKLKGETDPELTWKITKGTLVEGNDLTGINISREAGEEEGTYPIHVSLKEGTNPDYYIVFVDGTLRIVDAVYHEAVEPTYTTIGNIGYWENKSDGKYYSDAGCTHEITPSQVFSYAKLKSNPVTANKGFTIDDITFGGVLFNWGAQTTYSSTTLVNVRSVVFTVYGSDVANARLKWTKDHPNWQYGRFSITIYVNNKPVYSVNQDDNKSLSGFFTVPLPDLKTGDVVKFEVEKATLMAEWEGSPTITACLEYTSSNGGLRGIHIMAQQDPNHKDNYYTTFYSSTDTYRVPEDVDVKAYTASLEQIPDESQEPTRAFGTGASGEYILRLTALPDGIIPADEPVLLRLKTKDNTAEQVNIALALTDFVQKRGNNILIGTDVARTLGTNDFTLLCNRENGFGFFNRTGIGIGANKAYLNFGSLDIKSLRIVFDDGPVTGAEQYFESQSEQNKVPYNLQGMPVDESYRGLIILDGKLMYKE